jgi:hypothetical protein
VHRAKKHRSVACQLLLAGRLRWSQQGGILTFLSLLPVLYVTTNHVNTITRTIYSDAGEEDAPLDQGQPATRGTV